MTDTYSIRFHGTNITPKSFTLKETGDLLIKIEESILALIEDRFISLDKKDVKLSLVQVNNKSSEYAIYTGNDSEVNSAVHLWGGSIADNSYVNFPKAAQIGLEKIFSLTHLKNCNTEFKKEKNVISSINPESKFLKQDKVLLDVDCVVYGDLVKIGDDRKPKIWIRLFNNEVRSVDASIDIVKTLSDKIYSPIAFRGKKRVNVLSNDIIGFKLYELIEYTPFQAKNSFDRLKNLTSGVWDKFQTQEEITEFLVNG